MRYLLQLKVTDEIEDDVRDPVDQRGERNRLVMAWIDGQHIGGHGLIAQVLHAFEIDGVQRESLLKDVLDAFDEIAIRCFVEKQTKVITNDLKDVVDQEAGQMLAAVHAERAGEPVQMVETLLEANEVLASEL